MSNVRLIGKTTGFVGTEYENKSIDEMIVGIARLSSSRETNELFNEPYKLIRHCLLQGHWSIFDTCNLVIEITTSRAMGRELLRHWVMKKQEFSQRYSPVNNYEEIELRKQCTNNRQSSTEVFNPLIDQYSESLNTDISQDAESLVEEHLDKTFAIYNLLLDNGIAREVARFILPECTQTKLIINGTVREWITTLNQRLHKTAQKEIRLIAENIKNILISECPEISRGLYNFDSAYDIHILDRLILEKYNVYKYVELNK